MNDSVFFQMEYQSGAGDDWTQRKASVHNRRDGKVGYVLYTSTVGQNHTPRYFRDMGKAIAAGMRFAQEGL